MEMMKNSIKSAPKTHFIKLNNIFSIFIFIFLISFSVSICSYTHHVPNYFTDSNDRHYIFLLCNGILFFLFINFNSTHGSSSLKQNQPVITDEIDRPPVLVSSVIEPVAAMEEQLQEIEKQKEEIGEEQEEEIEEQKEEIEEEREEDDEDDEIERNGNWFYVNEDHNAVSIIQIEDEMAEQYQLGVVEEQETEESEEAAETEELNKKCAEFIRNMRQRMKCESSYRYRSSLQYTKINATISF